MYSSIKTKLVGTYLENGQSKELSNPDRILHIHFRNLTQVVITEMIKENTYNIQPNNNNADSELRVTFPFRIKSSAEE